ncbi:hypothetical protein FACS1894174_03600 [Bacteroidia bacterium]|nr:hypothetical protein FACS1894174_03600 [Bacteroidia bacterium]
MSPASFHNCANKFSGIPLFRNFDHEFEKLLQKESSERKIKVNFELQEHNFGFSLTVMDEDQFQATVNTEFKKELSQKNQQENIRTQLSKLGNTIFESQNINIRLSDNWFIPSSILAGLRRNVIERLISVRKIAFPRAMTKIRPTSHPYPETELSYLGNVSNKKAVQFYEQHGVTSIEPALETGVPENPVLMQSKYCIRYQLDCCPKKPGHSNELKQPFSLINGNNRLRLLFDCNLCEMKVF